MMTQQSRPARAGGKLKVSLLALMLQCNACSTYTEKVAPIALPSESSQGVVVNQVFLTAQAYVDPQYAEQAFGFDIRESGLLPVRVVVDNQGASAITIKPEQTFLIDQVGQAWPLLSSSQAYERVKNQVELSETVSGALKPTLLMGAAGAVAGFAIGILTGKLGESIAKGTALGASAGALYGGTKQYGQVEQEIRRDLGRQTLRNYGIKPGELAYGFLFFPGKNEAETAKWLRLALESKKDNSLEIVKIALAY